jgi:hypothetical protein
MAFKMKYKNLQGVVDELRGAVKAHGKQADTIEKHIDKIENTPMKKGYDYSPYKKAKGIDGKACWKGYELRGTKKKGGRTVDNCVKM